MSLIVLRTIPVLRIFDVAKARAFYVDYLGFEVKWEHRFDADSPLYMEVALGELTLHLSEHHGDGSPGAHVFVRVRGVAEFHASLAAKNYRHLRPGLDETFHQSRCVRVIDPFGNRIQFDESNDASS